MKYTGIPEAIIAVAIKTSLAGLKNMLTTIKKIQIAKNTIGSTRFT